jgi:hypothetical protein
MHYARLSLLTAALAMLCIGCGAQMYPDAAGYSASPSSPVVAPLGEDLQLTAFQEPGRAPEEEQPATADRPRLQRKIIYTATLDLIVESFAEVPVGIDRLVRQFDAFVANSTIDTASGRPRSGTWTVRVPVARYDEFLAAAGSLGELQRRTESSREVTAEYYDLDTRIRNKLREEERLREHLASNTGTLEEVLAVEKELSRVRTEVEQLQGQLRVLQDLTALSTVTLSLREIQGYVPVESPTFATRLGRAWTQSLEGLLTAGQLTVIAAVALAPWLLVMAVLIALGVAVARRWFRRKKVVATNA